MSKHDREADWTDSEVYEVMNLARERAPDLHPLQGWTAFYENVAGWARAFLRARVHPSQLDTAVDQQVRQVTAELWLNQDPSADDGSAA